jgi:hypothetical protein
MSVPSVATVEGVLTEAYRRTFGGGDFNSIVRLLARNCSYRQPTPRGWLEDSGANAVCLALAAWQQAFRGVQLRDLTVRRASGADLVRGANACYRVSFTLEGETVRALPGLDFAMALGRHAILPVTHFVWTTVEDGRSMILAIEASFSLDALR